MGFSHLVAAVMFIFGSKQLFRDKQLFVQRRVIKDQKALFFLFNLYTLTNFLYIFLASTERFIFSMKPNTKSV